MRGFVLVLAAAIVATGLGLHAQETKKQSARPAAGRLTTAKKATAPADRAADEKAIEALVGAYTKAFDVGDAKAAAATYAENAVLVNEHGERTIGRAAIEGQLAGSLAANRGDKIAISIDSLFFPGPDTALEEGRTTITPAAGGAPEFTQYTAVYIKHAGQWLLSALREELDDRLTPHDHLTALEWMVGEWVNESHDAVVNTTCKWTDDGNFLVRDFTMKRQGEPVLSGTQRIGWDPTRQQFKTWIFDSEGGFGQGYWTHNNDHWVIKAEGTRQDGRHASATSIITPLGKDRASWRSVDRSIGNLAVPGIDEFIIVRKPPEAGK